MAAFVVINSPVDGHSLVWNVVTPQSLQGFVGGVNLALPGPHVTVQSGEGAQQEIYFDTETGEFDQQLHLISEYLPGEFELTVRLLDGDDEVLASATVSYTVVDPATVPAPASVRAAEFLLGQHLCNTLHFRGLFFDGAAATFGDGSAACRVTLVDDNNLTVVTPLCDREGTFTMAVSPGEGITATEFAVRVVGDGYRILRSLLPRGRYTDDVTNPFNVRLAARGHQLDLIEYARRSLVEQELFPQFADVLLFRHEENYGIPTVAGDSLAVRRARVLARALMTPRISLPYLERIVQAVIAGGEIVENEDYDVYGDLIWQGQVYEPSSGYLDAVTWAELERVLNEAASGWTLHLVGASGFIVGTSFVGRDFLDSED